MEDYKIDKKPYRGERKMVSFRLPCDLLEDLERLSKATGYNSTELLEKALGKLIVDNKELLGRGRGSRQ